MNKNILLNRYNNNVDLLIQAVVIFRPTVEHQYYKPMKCVGGDSKDLDTLSLREKNLRDTEMKISEVGLATHVRGLRHRNGEGNEEMEKFKTETDKFQFSSRTKGKFAAWTLESMELRDTDAREEGRGNQRKQGKEDAAKSQ